MEYYKDGCCIVLKIKNVKYYSKLAKRAQVEEGGKHVQECRSVESLLIDDESRRVLEFKGLCYLVAYRYRAKINSKVPKSALFNAHLNNRYSLSSKVSLI